MYELNICFIRLMGVWKGKGKGKKRVLLGVWGSIFSCLIGEV